MLRERVQCDSDDPLPNNLPQLAIEAGIDPGLATKLSQFGQFAIDGPSCFTLTRTPDGKTGAELKVGPNLVEFFEIRDGARRRYGHIHSTGLSQLVIDFAPNGNLTVKRADWHPFDVFCISSNGSVVLNTRE